MAIDNYILSFDLTKSTSQIEELEKSFIDLSKSVGDFSKVVRDFSQLERSLNNISTLLDKNIVKTNKFFSNFKKGLKSSLEYIRSMDKSLLSINKSVVEFGSISIDDLEKKVAQSGASADFKSSEDIANSALKKAEQALRLAKNSMKEAESVVGKIGTFEQKVGDIIGKEARGAKSKIAGMIGGIGGGGIVGGGIVASLLSMIILGVQEKQRLAAERGEMLNILEATNDVFTKQGQKTVSSLARFAEEAQYKFGIGRKEVHAVTKQLVDIGASSEEIGKKWNNSLFSVNNNIVNLTLSLDKHLGLATGTSMKNAVTLITQLGESTDTAADKYRRLALAAKESGIGTEKFISSVMAGSSALSQYGVEMEDVEQLLVKIKSHYTDMGLDTKQAGDVAAKTTVGIAKGLTGLSEGIKAMIAKKMYPEMETFTALQRLQEGMARYASGQDEDFLVEFAGNYLNLVKNQIGVSASPEERRAKSIKFMTEQGMDHLTATTFYDVASKLEKGQKISEAQSETMKGWFKAFKTEGQQLTELQKNQRDLIRGFAKIGEGLLKVVSGILGTLIMGFKALPTIASAAFEFFSGNVPGAYKILEDFSEIMNLQFDTIGEGLGLVVEGGKQTASAVGDLSDIIFGPNLMKALTSNLGGKFGEITSAIKDIATKQSHFEAFKNEVEELVMPKVDWLMNKIGFLSDKEVERLAQTREIEREDTLNKINREKEAARKIKSDRGKSFSVPESSLPKKSAKVNFVLSGETVEKSLSKSKRVK